MAEAETEAKVVEGSANGTCPPDDTGPPESTGEAETVKKEEAVTAKKEDTTGVEEMEEDSVENEKNGAVGKDEDHKLKEEENKQEKEREEQELEDVTMEEETEIKEEKESKEIVENADKKEEKESKEIVENADKKEEKESKVIVENADEKKEKECKENVVSAEEKEEKESRENIEIAQENESKEDIENSEENKEETVKAKPSKGEKRSIKHGKGSDVGEKEVAKKNKVDEKNVKATNTPTASSLDRPVRERKSVERLVVSIEKEPAKDFHIEKGRGTPLKEIPNVAYKLSRKKTDDTFKSLYMILFGRRGKASDVKKNISQFSGFVWHENEEKQRMKLKEKFDKCFKEKLLEFCDVLDIPVVKTATRKEDIVVKLIDFLAAPHAMTDVLIAEKEQSSKDRKRKRSVKGTASKSGGASAKSSSRKRRKSEDTPKGKDKKSAPDTEDESEEEDEENDNGIPDAPEEVLNHSENEDKEDESVEESEEDMGKHKRGSRKSSSKKKSAGKTNMKKRAASKKATPITSPKKTPRKSLPKHSEVNDSSDKSPRVFSRKKKDEETRKKASNPVKSAVKEKAGKKVVKGKDKSREEEPGPSGDELRRAICEILKEVDFNTATFTDILKLLARQFNTDLMPRKSAIKLLIQEELTKLADEADDNGDDEGEGDEKEDEPTGGQEVEA